MCGRFVSSSSPADLASYFGAEGSAPVEEALEPNYNVAPTSDVYVVHADGGVRRVDAFHWGLVPIWAKDPKVGNRMINARSETLASKGAFKPAFKRRRCIVPADGFFEWKKLPGQKRKQPYFIHRPDDEPFAFAGLWEVWKGPDKTSDEVQLRSTTIITTSANEPMAAIHDRMPVVLPPSAWDDWLDPDNEDIDTLGQLLVPAPAALITMHPVGTDVGNVRNRGPQLTEEIPPDAVLEPAGADASTGSESPGDG
jgi:putative SOS response-associated peptidase YedK